MSDTPRTDAVEGYDDEYSNPELLALCRQLERELHSAHLVLKVIAKAELFDTATGIIDADVLEAVREEARKVL